ncbi:nickel/cobalt transporter [Vibrio sp. 10N.261.55.A7]|uniref:nickel/cobalt transporter n=1 Tax=Vibrio sp. 10N.261.55.A7 TaxID=1880851 RepID=UPI001F52E208|nr:nickel/cobalt transporter [Vibrio sp. 10N.261.55.A7]
MLSRRHYVSAIVMVAFVFCLYQLWLMWPSIVVSSIQWQREVNTQLADLLYEAKTNPLIAGSYLIGFSFLYGALHSLGPGHGKVIVTTYLATHPAKIKTSLMLTVISALCQALVAILLVSVLVWGFNASMRVVNQQATVFLSLSFALVSILGALICWKAIKQLYLAMRPTKLRILNALPLSGAQAIKKESAAMKSAIHTPTSSLLHKPIIGQASHAHGTDCGCGHQHVADADAVNKASTYREYMGIIASIGARPCSGAIMVLLFANIAELYWMGVASAIVMAIGTAMTTSLIALMTLTGKFIVQRYLILEKNSHSKRWKLTSYGIQLLGGLFLILVGMILMSGQSYGVSPMFSV